jgi:orotidine-5'-phosphate decarboxylase
MGPEPRDRLAIALDVDDLVVAVRLAKAVREHIGVAKVGLELYSAVGPDALTAMIDLGFIVFADIKLHDIPTTVRRSATVFGALGVSYLNFHAAGGEAMLAAGVEGLLAGADGAGLPAPVALAVTVLTSDHHAPPDLLAERARLAVTAGCGGVVCAVADIAAIRAVGSGLVCVTPGIRMLGNDANDQGRVASPREAIASGADLLVIGRPITAAEDPRAAAAAAHAEVAAALPEGARIV